MATFGAAVPGRSGIARAEGAPGQQRQSHRPEVPGRHVHRLNFALLALDRDVALNRHTAGPRRAGPETAGRQAGRTDSRQGLDGD